MYDGDEDDWGAKDRRDDDLWDKGVEDWKEKGAFKREPEDDLRTCYECGEVEGPHDQFCPARFDSMREHSLAEGTCKTCQGNGYYEVWDEDQAMYVEQPCTSCRGDGYSDEDNEDELDEADMTPKRLTYKFNQCQHQGDANFYAEDILASGGNILDTELNLEAEECTITFEVKDYKQFLAKFKTMDAINFVWPPLKESKMSKTSKQVDAQLAKQGLRRASVKEGVPGWNVTLVIENEFVKVWATDEPAKLNEWQDDEPAAGTGHDGPGGYKNDGDDDADDVCPECGVRDGKHASRCPVGSHNALLNDEDMVESDDGFEDHEYWRGSKDDSCPECDGKHGEHDKRCPVAEPEMNETDPVSKPKRVRQTCKACSAVKYANAAEIDRSEPFLCDRCDDKYIMWNNTTDGDGSLDTFLRSRKSRT